MLLALTLLACADPSDTGAERLAVTSEADSRSGDHHLVLSLDPDPPSLGPQTGVIALTRNVDSAALDGALVAGATLTGTLTAPEAPGTTALEIAFEEEPSGTYTAEWTWTTDGYWELRVVIGSLEEDDEATFAVLVDPAS